MKAWRCAARNWIRGLRAGRPTVPTVPTVPAALAVLAHFAACAALAQSNVDTIITNGKILTVDAEFSIVEALAIDAGRIVARGTSAEIASHAGADTEIIDVP
jgi:hypothetical protein